MEIYGTLRLAYVLQRRESGLEMRVRVMTLNFILPSEALNLEQSFWCLYLLSGFALVHFNKAA